MVQVYTRDVCVRHHAPFFSTANFFNLLSALVVILLAFYAAYSSGALWKKSGEYREQPIVRFRNEIVLTLDTIATVSASYQIKRVWTTFPDLRDLTSNAALLAASVKSRELDDNNDGRVDRINVVIEVPLDGTFTVRGVQAALFVNVRLQDQVAFEMNSVAIAAYQSTLPGAAITTDGQLLIQQVAPLDPFTKLTAFTSAPSINNPTTLSSFTNFDPSIWLRRFATQNVSTVFVDTFPMWMNGIDNRFTVNMTMRIPSQTILYTPGFAEVIKFAWIQYLSIAFVLYYLIVRWLGQFLFTANVVQTDVRRDGESMLKSDKF